MHIGRNIRATAPRHIPRLLRNFCRLALMLTLFALTCWEVNPGQMPMPEGGPESPATSVTAAAAQSTRIDQAAPYHWEH